MPNREGAHDRIGGHEVATFRATMSGPMPPTQEWVAIENGRVQASKSFPDAGSVRFVAYELDGDRKYAIIRMLERGFEVPREYRRFIVEAFADYEAAASAYPLAVGWLSNLVDQFGPDLFGEEWERRAQEWAKETPR